MTYLDLALLSLIEGITEFLPISSTGHLIILSSLLKIVEDPFTKHFNIIIQGGAILSVLVLYRHRLIASKEFYFRIGLGFLPAAVIGMLVKNRIDALLESVATVGWALLIGGIVLILTDKRKAKVSEEGKTVMQLSYQDCLKIGLIQCLAFIPGVSRSAASILGGLHLGLSRKESAEFSFFLAVPTLAGASLIKSRHLFTEVLIGPLEVFKLLLGILLSFIFALLAIKFFITLVQKYGFYHFGVYRIVLGIFVLFGFYQGVLT